MNNFETIEFQKNLSEFYEKWYANIEEVDLIPTDKQYISHINLLEESWDEYEESKIQSCDLPEKYEDFEVWWNDLASKHKAKVSDLFEYAEAKASLEQLAFFICLDDKVDGHFDDLIAYAQIGMKGKARLVIAENYWDEMGRGDITKVHTEMFSLVASYLKGRLKISDDLLEANIPCDAYKNGNILQMYASRRHWIGRLYGALSILEFTAPDRFHALAKGLRRFGIDEKYIEYFQSHVEFDEDHGYQLLHNLLLPVIKDNPTLMKEICIGALIRYRIAVDYYKTTHDLILNSDFNLT